MTDLFRHGFEGGDFGNDPETGYAWTTYSGATVVATPYRGTYGALLDAQYDQCYVNIAGQTLLYYRFHFKTPATIPTSYTRIAKTCYGAVPDLACDYRYKTGNIEVVRNKPGWAEVVGTQTWATLTWYCIEGGVYVNASGWHKLWVDEAIKCDETGVNTTGYGTITRACLELDASGTSFNADCVVVANTGPIGPEPSAAVGGNVSTPISTIISGLLIKRRPPKLSQPPFSSRFPKFVPRVVV